MLMYYLHNIAIFNFSSWVVFWKTKLLTRYCWNLGERRFISCSNLFLALIRHIFESITACKDAAYIDVKTSRMLMKLPGITSINKTEDSLLALSALDSVDSLYYCSTLKFDIDNSTYIVNKHLEFGHLKNFQLIHLKNR